MLELKKKHGSGNTTLIISKEKMNDIMKIIQALGDSNILIKSLKQLKMKQKNKKENFKYVIRYFRS